MLVRKKPVKVLAHQWFKNGDHPDDGPATQEGSIVRHYPITDDIDSQTKCRYCGVAVHAHGWIDTMEGGHIVCPGDWVITGFAGERYPCKDAIFQKTYEIISPLDEPIAYG